MQKLLALVPIALLTTGCATGLPTTISNNAVATAAGASYSFGGMTDPTDNATIIAKSWQVDPVIRQIPDLPGPPRIGASAIALGGSIYVVGGYSVVETQDSHDELTATNLYRFDPLTESWHDLGPVPVPVDDTAMATLHGRYLYLFSGWHGPARDNVRNVQLYDTAAKAWIQCTAIPTPAVFGHVAGIVETDRGPVAVVADGVKLVTDQDGRSFAISDAVCVGAIDPEHPSRIDWTVTPPHPGSPTYRAGSALTPAGLLVVNGTSRPYNIDGTGYDGIPAEPLDQALLFDGESWIRFPAGFASMDHRGLIRTESGWAVVGGMTAPGKPSDKLQTVRTFQP